jgi:transketolase
MCLGLRLDSLDARVFVELSDGELQEGATWEAAMSASHFQLDNLVAIIDCNAIQADGPLVMNVEPVAQKWAAFGWDTWEIDGNSIPDLLGALEGARDQNKRPKAVISRTTPGKGVALIEQKEKGHFIRLDTGEWEQAMVQLEATA